MSNFIVRKVAVLGAGVMGAQIAAHCANANVPVGLFDLPAKGGVPEHGAGAPRSGDATAEARMKTADLTGTPSTAPGSHLPATPAGTAPPSAVDPNGIVKKALDGLKKLEPSPLATKDRVACIDVANYDAGLEQLRGCDLVIEAIAEKMEWKRDLYQKVAPYVAEHAIFASNTSLPFPQFPQRLPFPARFRLRLLVQPQYLVPQAARHLPAPRLPSQFPLRLGSQRPGQYSKRHCLPQ